MSQKALTAIVMVLEQKQNRIREMQEEAENHNKGIYDTIKEIGKRLKSYLYNIRKK